MATRHPDSRKVEALARLEANSGGLKRTARELELAPSTLRHWRDEAMAAGNGHLLPVAGDWHEIRERAAGKYLRTAEKARGIIERNLDRLSDADMSVLDVQRLSITAGILTDKSVALRGKGPEVQVNVDARTLLVGQMAALDPATLARLAREADVASQPAGPGVVESGGAPELNSVIIPSKP